VKRLHDLGAPVAVYVMIVRLTSRCLGIGGVGLGVAMLAGGPRRFASASLASARQVPGQQVTWGLIAFGLGVVILAAGHWHAWLLLQVSTSLLGTWCLFFATSIAISAAHDPDSGVIGVVTYTMVFGICTIEAVGLRIGRRADR
jgi:hypothetical protein